MAREMKDSGIEWIGEIPADWEIIRFKNVGQCWNGLTYSPNDLCDESEGTLVLRSSNIQNGMLSFNDNVYVNCHISEKNMIKKDDILICSRNGSAKLIGKNALIEKNINAAFGAFMMIYRCKYPRYMRYILNSDVFIYNLSSFLTSTVNQLTASVFYNIKFPFTDNVVEQRKIIDYLDKKCSQIDTALEKTRTTIEEYKKFKQAIITKAVTKGIRGDRPMKDSGIEWVGEIPVEWNVNKAFQIFSELKNKNIGLVEKNLLSLSYGKIKQKDINTKEGLLPESFEGYNVIGVDDIVLRLTDLQNDHKSLRVGLCTQKGIITSAYLTLRNSSENMAKYLYYQLHSFDIAKGFYGMGGGVRQGLNWDGLKNHLLAIPLPEEQQEIADYLDKKCAAIDILIAKKEQIITDLESYKKSLIYEYVTGKKEI